MLSYSIQLITFVTSMAGLIPAGCVGLTSSFFKTEKISIRGSAQTKQFTRGSNKFGYGFDNYLLSTIDERNSRMGNKRTKKILRSSHREEIQKFLKISQREQINYSIDEMTVKLKKACSDHYNKTLVSIPDELGRKQGSNVGFYCSIDSNPHGNVMNSRAKKMERTMGFRYYYSK